MSWPMTDLKHAIEEGRDWLRIARDLATDDPEACEGWPALGETAGKIEEALRAVEALLPMHAEIEAAVKEEWDDIGRYESPESLGLGRR